MADDGPGGLTNRVREERLRRGWSQDDLARRAGVSRAGVSATETGRLVPSAAAALALAAAFGCRVEDLFALPGSAPPGGGLSWAWEPGRAACRYWDAELGGRVVRYPVEATPLGVTPHDGTWAAAQGESHPSSPPPADPSRTLVLACCDPAVGLLAGVLARETGVRLIALPRSSGEALRLLRLGLVHAAGVHLARPGDDSGNDAAVRQTLGTGYTLIRAARWEEGVAVGPGLRFSSVNEALRGRLRWVGREPGSGARQCLDELLEGRRPPRRLARDHRGVAEAVRSGWADAGVCLRLTGEEAGLDFLPVREEAYDLCAPTSFRHDPRFEALTRVLRSTPYRKLLAALPGYDAGETGETRKV